MKIIFRYIAAGLIAAIPAAALSQLGLPRVDPVLPERSIGQVTEPLLDPLSGTLDYDVLDRLNKSELATILNRLRIERVDKFVRDNRDSVERDRHGDPAVRGILLATGISAASLDRARAAGFILLEQTQIEGLDLNYVKFAVRSGNSLKVDQKALEKIAGEAEISADNIYFTSGSDHVPAALNISALAAGQVQSGAMGLIDGGVARHQAIKIPVEQRGFAKGGPKANGHATAIASLISSTQHGVSPGLLAADIYGSDPAGGNAIAIAQALGWMVQRKVPVVTISLVGPNNPLLARAVAIAQQKGMMIVAAVGNDGPAAPPRYPAAYKGVIGVTGVDARERPLPEAGIATPVDFAAPGARIKGASVDGKLISLRGTSFAAPLVASRLAAHHKTLDPQHIARALSALINEAKDLGKRGADKIYGHGLICRKCGLR